MKDIKLYGQLESEDSKIFQEILEASQEVVKYELNVDRIVCKGDEIYLYIGKVYVTWETRCLPARWHRCRRFLRKLGDQEGTLHLENYSESSGTITFDIGEIPQ